VRSGNAQKTKEGLAKGRSFAFVCGDCGEGIVSRRHANATARKRARAAGHDTENTRLFPGDGCPMCAGTATRGSRQYWSTQAAWIQRFLDGSGTLIAQPACVNDASVLVLGERSAARALAEIRRRWPMLV
jgi:hypothetical protein